MPQYILKVYCHQYSVLAVYTANLVYHIVQLSGYRTVNILHRYTAHLLIIYCTMQYSISVPSSNTPVSKKLQYMTILHIHFKIVAVYLQYILQTSWSVHSVYTTTILPYTESLLYFGLGIKTMPNIVR